MGIEKEPTQPDFYLFKGCAERSSGLDIRAAESIAEAIVRWKNFKITEVSQSNPIIAQRLWLAHLTLGEIYWDLERYTEAYPSLLEATQTLPNAHPKWSATLNNTIALAIEYEDIENITTLFNTLFRRADTPLDMFYFRLDQLKSLQREEEARELLSWALKTSSRIKKSPQTSTYKTIFGL